MTIRDLDEANRALLPFVPLVSKLKGKDMTLKRIKPLMKLLGNPEEKLRVIHIAGTSGKTSTAYFMAALLQAAGKQTGLTVSPHIDSVTERVQINGRPLPEVEFCELLGEFLEIVAGTEQMPTYFELLYAFALWAFKRQGVDYAVVETGMGGLHDATNVARRSDKICVLTDIGLDHTHILGKTLPEIAAQKAGIIHRRNQVFMYEQAPEIMGVIQGRMRRHKASLHLADQRSSLPGAAAMAGYQRRNWELAYTVYMYLSKRDSLQHLTSKALRRTQELLIPVRMERRAIKNKTLVMDGAHNAQKMAAFVSSFQQLYPDIHPAILISLKAGKDYEDAVRLLTPLASRIITTKFVASQDLPVASMDPQLLAAAFRAKGALQAMAILDQREAFRALLDGPEKVSVITGSFYLLSQIRNNEGII